jgi:transposase
LFKQNNTRPVRAVTRLFRFLLRVQGAVVTGVRVVTDKVSGERCVELEIRRRTNSKPRCSTCNAPLAGEIKTHRRRWRHLDLFRVRAYLVYDLREGCCHRHGRRTERTPWASTGALHTRAFERAVGHLVQVADKSAVARIFKVAWRTVSGMVRRLVTETLPGDLLDGLVAIGVDETSYKRGHHYLTVVSCLMTGRVVWVGEGKSASTLGCFFAELGSSRCAKIEAVLMDMSEAYLKAVKEHAPQADVVYDRFHVVKLLLEAVDETRREECRRMGHDEKRATKRSRYAFLRNPKHLKPSDLEAIARIEKTNRKLARLFQLRADIEQVWDLNNEEEARAFLMRWTRAALVARMPELRRFALTVRKHLHGILGFFRHHGQTNSVLEGTNNKIKLIIHRAYGFHCVAALMAMIHLCCSGLDLS